MFVPGLNSIKNTTATTKRRGVSASDGFADLLSAAEAGDTHAPPATSDVAATAALNQLLALQEISEEDIQRKKLVQRGSNLLDSLERLRGQLLVGTLGPEVLLDLGRQLAIEKQSVTDPALSSLIEDIELRAAVELAKLQMAVAAKGTDSL